MTNRRPLFSTISRSVRSSPQAMTTPFGTVHASNLTPDRATGLGDWTVADFRRAFSLDEVADHGAEFRIGHRIVIVSGDSGGGSS